VDPRRQVVGNEFRHAFAVPIEVVGGDAVGPLARRAGAEETCRILPVVRLGEAGHHVVGSVAHPRDACLGRQLRQPRAVETEPTHLGEPHHLSHQVVLVVEEVEQADVRAGAAVPSRGEVVQHVRERHLLGRRWCRLDELAEPHCGIGVGRRDGVAVGQVVEAHRFGAAAHERLEIEVRHVVLPRHHHVARIAPDHEIGDVVTKWESVERRVRLDEPAMGLAVVEREHLVLRPDSHVEPRRQGIELRREVGPVEDRQRTQHLCPGRARLRWRRDHDVARTVLESDPSLAVGDEGPVGHEPGHRRILAGRAPADVRADQGLWRMPRDRRTVQV
jgi:hypothetical protein